MPTGVGIFYKHFVVLFYAAHCQRPSDSGCAKSIYTGEVQFKYSCFAIVSTRQEFSDGVYFTA